MSDDYMTRLLKDGYAIEGYSTTIMAAGAMTHSVLLRKAERVECVTVVTNGDKEVGRQYHRIAPAPVQEQKRGFW